VSLIVVRGAPTFWRSLEELQYIVLPLSSWRCFYEEEFLKFMNLLDSQLPGETQIHIVLDNLATFLGLAYSQTVSATGSPQNVT
jgi:hypothetical protein